MPPGVLQDETLALGMLLNKGIIDQKLHVLTALGVHNAH